MWMVHEHRVACRRSGEACKSQVELPLELFERRLIACEQRACKRKLPLVSDRNAAQCAAPPRAFGNDRFDVCCWGRDEDRRGNQRLCRCHAMLARSPHPPRRARRCASLEARARCEQAKRREGRRRARSQRHFARCDAAAWDRPFRRRDACPRLCAWALGGRCVRGRRRAIYVLLGARPLGRLWRRVVTRRAGLDDEQVAAARRHVCLACRLAYMHRLEADTAYFERAERLACQVAFDHDGPQQQSGGDTR